MYYHNITMDDMLNGDGLRTVLWVSGCSHKCPGCQNPITWDSHGGIYFDDAAERELFRNLQKDYISGVTFSGGDPLHPLNRMTIAKLAKKVKARFPTKTIWVYTGYTWERIYLLEKHDMLYGLLKLTDVIVDGPYVERLRDISYPWAGSTNQRVIDVKKTLEKGEVVLWKN